jgi:3-isopropylmalate/(R)-2-methylmalate dehydratase large subunit
MGIEHALLPELGLIRPGDLVVGADSHTCTYGALGAYSCGIGSTDLARFFVDGRCWLKVPKTVKFVYKGRLNKWIGGKDIILFTIGQIGVDGALYRVMEFSGETIRSLEMDSRFTISNMAIEAGARAGIIEPDTLTFNYLKTTGRRMPVSGKKASRRQLQAGNRLCSDPDADYEKKYEWQIGGLEPQVACPHLPSNVKPVGALADIKIDQVVIGSCTNGRISDMRMSAKILKGRKINPGLRLIVIPATQKIYLQALQEGLAEIFVRAGGVFSTPTCGPCLGGHLGILTEGEVALATTNRNFIGRMGSPKSFVYLCNPAVAAASAITGRITHPAEVM